MKKTILLLTALMIVGCERKITNGSNDISKNPWIETLVIDSCEYINGFNKIIHKGNCRFCKKRRQKELEELAIKLKEK